jgi:hypothetical protein
MRKADEITFYAALHDLHGGPYNANKYRVFADEVAVFLGLHPNRAHSLLLKWTHRGYWEYGVSPRGGWFTPEAPERLEP